MELSVIENYKIQLKSGETVEIHPYLDYAQIQQIADAVCKFESWSMRQTNYDMLLLYHATNIGKEELEKHTHEELLKSGLISEVKRLVLNLNQVDEAIAQNDSVMRSLNSLLKELTKAVGPISKVIGKNAKTSSQK